MTAAPYLFLYGTLCHRPLLDVVAGFPVSVRPGRLAGHAVHVVTDGTFPVIGTAPGAVAEGLVVPADPAMRARMNYYEGGYGFALRSVEVETPDGAIAAEVYFPDPGRWSPAAPWSLDDWARDHGAQTVAAAEEAMAHYGRWSAETLARRFPMLRARAASRLRAAATGAPASVRMGPDRSRINAAAPVSEHAGFFLLDRVDLDHPTFAGGRSGPVTREVFVGTDASLVLPYDPTTDRVLLVEQFRVGPYRRGDPRPWALEPVAGLIDPGETPQDAARREAREEAGLVLGHLEKVTAGYPSPGATTEFYHCYVGLCDLSRAGGSGGLAEEDEDIHAHVLDRRAAMDLIASGEANVVPLVMLLLWLDANHIRLRSLS